MARNLLYLSYYFDPDLSAGSFRNTSLATALAKTVDPTTQIHLICSMPNRYGSFTLDAPEYEKRNNLHIYRIPVDKHQNGFLKQVFSFWQYRKGVKKIVSLLNINAIFASSSKLFTAYLAYQLSYKKSIPYYLDIRDLFAENIKELIPYYPINMLASSMLTLCFQKPTFHAALHININSYGFIDAIPKSKHKNTSFFPNGIDDDFLELQTAPASQNNKPLILYAGNIGSGQGLEKIIPEVAKTLEDKYDWLIIGDGSTKSLLEASIKKHEIKNIQLLNPIARKELINWYKKADILFLHLNDFKSFEKVIPSKLFEYGATNRFIVAGVAGYPAQFIREQVKEHYFVFNPCDAGSLIQFLKTYTPSVKERPEFIEKFNRKKITHDMATSIKYVLDL